MLAARNDTKALAAVIRSWKEVVVDDEKLTSNRVPTLSLIGSHDPLKARVDALKGIMGELKVVVIDGGNHMITPGRPAFLPNLKEFLAAHRQ